MAAIFPPFSKGGVPPSGSVAYAYVPTHPVIGEGPLYTSSECSTALTADQMNGLVSEILATVDRLGFSYNSAGVTNMGDAIAARLNDKVTRSGDTMTGPLILSNHAITVALQSTTKEYVDANDASILSTLSDNITSGDAALQTQIDAKVNRAGDTMTGFLVLHAEPVNPFDAATKSYVDGHTGGGGGGIPEAPFDGTTYGRYNQTWVRVLNLTGGAMTGNLSLVGDPGAPMHATTKQYVDGQVAIAINASDGKVEVAGDTMTGFLSLSANPTANMHATPKQYVDAADSALSGTVNTVVASLNNKVSKTGDTMTGPLILYGNPANNLEPATKQYVDAVATGINARVARAGDTMLGFLTLNADPTNNLHAATKQYVDTHGGGSGGIPDAPADGNTYGRNNNAWAVVGGGAAGPYVPIAGGTMTGLLTLSGPPTSGLHAATKTYADTKVVRTGDTMSGPLTLNADPTAALHAATKQYSDLNLPKVGGTMTGFITLNADPTDNLHPATKNYVDNAADARVAVTGDTMTGPLVLAGPPTVANHAATKAYVDGASGFTTGDVKITLKNVADPGWLLFNDGTIGNTGSGSTFANGAAQALFTLIFTNFPDSLCPLYTNTGALTTRAAAGSAAASWGANHRMALPLVVGRALAGAGAGVGLTARALGQSAGAETETPTIAKTAPHAHGIFLDYIYGGGTYAGTYAAGTSANVGQTGGGSVLNIMQPTVFLNVMVKL